MKTDFVGHARDNPLFAELVQKRSRFGWTLAAIMALIYAAFIFCVAFAPGIMAIQVGGGVTLGFPLGLAVLLSAIVITGIYVLRANAQFDDLTRRIVKGAR